MKYVIGLLMLAAAQTAAWSTPHHAAADALKGATAMVSSIDAGAYTVELRVNGFGTAPMMFQISPTCLYTDGLMSAGDLHVNSRILIWTEAGQTGTLPVITRMARAQS